MGWLYCIVVFVLTLAIAIIVVRFLTLLKEQPTEERLQALEEFNKSAEGVFELLQKIPGSLVRLAKAFNRVASIAIRGK